MAEALQAQIALLQAQLEEVRLGQSEQFKQAVQAGVAEAVRAANPVADPATRRYDTACRRLSSAPTFDGKTPWRTFESSFSNWGKLSQMADMPILFQKQVLLNSMRGHAVELTRPFAEGTEAFRNAGNIDNYIEIFRKIFLPPEESELAESEFRGRKQGRREDISSYISAKIALWQCAFSERDRSFKVLKRETINGIVNKKVKRDLVFATIESEIELRSKAVKLVAAERECYHLGVAESTSLDGLAATTQIAKASYQEEEDMEVDEGVRTFFEGNCHKCGDKGHKARDCTKGRGKAGPKEKGCFRCGRTTHLKRDCVAKRRLDGTIIPTGGKDNKEYKKGEKKNFSDKKKGKPGVRRTQDEATEEDPEEQDFLGSEGESDSE